MTWPAIGAATGWLALAVATAWSAFMMATDPPVTDPPLQAITWVLLFGPLGIASFVGYVLLTTGPQVQTRDA